MMHLVLLLLSLFAFGRVVPSNLDSVPGDITGDIAEGVTIAADGAPPLSPVQQESEACTGTRRNEVAFSVHLAYNLPIPASDTALRVIDFANNAQTFVSSFGSPLMQVASNRAGTVDYAIRTRHLFQSTVYNYNDLPNENGALCHTQVTLAKSAHVPNPYTFTTDIYLHFNAACQLESVKAYAKGIDHNVANLLLHPPPV